MDNIVKAGGSQKIKECLISELSISPEDAEKVFDYLKTAYQENTAEFGCISQGTDSGRGLVFGDGQYYINLPKSVLMVIALILDITLTKGIVSGVCGMLGVQMQSFYHINQHKGETCLLRECLRNDKMADSDEYSHLTGKECINNDLKCQFRNGAGQCSIQKKILKKYLHVLGRHRLYNMNYKETAND